MGKGEPNLDTDFGEADLNLMANGQKILLAAYNLGRNADKSFTAEELAVEVWSMDPDSFGLEGFTKMYPDCNKVNSYIMGKRGLVHRGYLIKLAPKLYRVTKDGRCKVEKAQGKEHSKPEAKPLLERQSRLLTSLFGSTAYVKFQDDKKELTFTDACKFWEITQNMKGGAIDITLNALHNYFLEINQRLAHEDGLMASGRVVTAGDIRVLANLHDYLQDRFENLLNLLRNRK